MSLINHQFRLGARPVGLPKCSDWNDVEEPVADPGPGEVLVKVLYLSLDPAMARVRGRGVPRMQAEGRRLRPGMPR
jgi:NADPH-dependent curcumin reductase CurA